MLSQHEDFDSSWSRGEWKKLWCCLVFNLFFLLIFLMVCCKQGLVAEAEAVLSFIIF